MGPPCGSGRGRAVRRSLSPDVRRLGEWSIELIHPAVAVQPGASSHVLHVCVQLVYLGSVYGFLALVSAGPASL